MRSRFVFFSLLALALALTLVPLATLPAPAVAYTLTTTMVVGDGPPTTASSVHPTLDKCMAAAQAWMEKANQDAPRDQALGLVARCTPTKYGV